MVTVLGLLFQALGFLLSLIRTLFDYRKQWVKNISKVLYTPRLFVYDLERAVYIHWKYSSACGLYGAVRVCFHLLRHTRGRVRQRGVRDMHSDSPVSIISFTLWAGKKYYNGRK